MYIVLLLDNIKFIKIKIQLWFEILNGKGWMKYKTKMQKFSETFWSFVKNIISTFVVVTWSDPFENIFFNILKNLEQNIRNVFVFYF